MHYLGHPERNSLCIVMGRERLKLGQYYTVLYVVNWRLTVVVVRVSLKRAETRVLNPPHSASFRVSRSEKSNPSFRLPFPQPGHEQK